MRGKSRPLLLDFLELHQPVEESPRSLSHRPMLVLVVLTLARRDLAEEPLVDFGTCNGFAGATGIVPGNRGHEEKDGGLGNLEQISVSERLDCDRGSVTQRIPAIEPFPNLSAGALA